jgi:hypothetical protein
MPAYGLTLPAAPASPAVARTVARTALRAHGPEAVSDAVVQAVGELAAAAVKFSGRGDDLYLSLRQRDGAVRVIVFDAHPSHAHPRLAGVCEARRRAELRLLAALANACHGDHGFGPAREPSGGTRMWAVLHLGGTAQAYGAASTVR